MGIYLNNYVKDADKWLEENAREVKWEELDWDTLPEGQLPLCKFGEAWCPVLICYFRQELLRAAPSAGGSRPRWWYLAPTEKVMDLLGPSMKSAILEDIRDGTTRDAIIF